jgi:hypothetical protein
MILYTIKIDDFLSKVAYLKQPVRNLLFCIMLLSSSLLNAQNYDWVKRMGGPGSEVARATIISNEYIYTIGVFDGTVDFNPNFGVHNLTSSGNSDLYIQKLDTAGNFIWAKRIGGSGSDGANAIVVDDSGNLYITGVFYGTVDFDPNSGVNTVVAQGAYNSFVLKLDALGDFVWVKKMGNGSAGNQGLVITIGRFGHVYTAGAFYGTADFNPNAGVATLVAQGTSQDIFIQKLDTAGNFIWTKSIGGYGREVPYGIEIDTFGNVHTLGTFRGLVDFDLGVNDYFVDSDVHISLFVQKLDSAGNFIWAKCPRFDTQTGSSGGSFGTSLALDDAGNVYAAGGFFGTVDFDPNIGVYNLTGSQNFIQKLDASGNFIWAQATDASVGVELALDAYGGLYAAGGFFGTVDFDPGTDTFNLTSTASGTSYNVYIQKMDLDGNFVWARNVQAINTGSSTVRAITVDNLSNVYAVGSFNDAVDFNPSIASNVLTSNNGTNDAFILKLEPCKKSTDTIMACGFYTWIDGVIYTENNNSATYLLQTIGGCDSLITLDLSINNNTGTDVIAACNSYTWINGLTYTSNNNTAKDTLTNVAGCDSVVTLDLSINNNTGTDVITACNSYTWINGLTYTSNNNTAKDTLTNVAGCDSVVTLDLSINTIDTALIVTDSSIMANMTSATYQWLNCDNGNFTIIAGDTAQGFEASLNGNYAVEISANGCVDTSNCVAIMSIGVIEINPFFNTVSVYPNPSKGLINIDLGILEEVAVSLFDVNGRVLYQKQNIKNATHQVKLDLVSGIYFVEIYAKGKRQYYKLIRE